MTNEVELDDYDRKILRALQANADISMADLGSLIGLSHTPCWRRLKRLETEGVIRSKVTLLDAKKIDLNVRVHAFVTAKNHDEDALSAFEAAVQSIPEIVECYSTSGDKDYILQIVTNSVDDYEQLMRKTLLKLPNVGSIHSTFSLKQIKYTTQLPI
ncbi:MAG TPA: Lrp/AsnC family transcriptional regulator [Cellvibrio sp.]|nr:Lrp/AsnC family transcriptional regulator [Cellvibrio sp.]